VAIPKLDLVSWFKRMNAFPMGSHALDRVLWRVVPLNAVLKPHLLDVGLDEVRVGLKIRKVLHNHLGSMHAGALFTVGEYSQGLLIMANAGAMGAELILVRLTIDYVAKARGDVVCTARINDETRQLVKDGLARGENTELVQTSVITDAMTGRELAVAKGTWKARPPKR
jgi:acyl-coenzyme A thioesterase PaaI-like protein